MITKLLKQFGEKQAARIYLKCGRQQTRHLQNTEPRGDESNYEGLKVTDRFCGESQHGAERRAVYNQLGYKTNALAPPP